jgi:hypothetical protein
MFCSDLSTEKYFYLNNIKSELKIPLIKGQKDQRIQQLMNEFYFYAKNLLPPFTLLAVSQESILASYLARSCYL